MRRLSAALLATTLVVAACGDDDDDESSTTDTPATAAPATDPPSTEPAATEPPATEPPATEPAATEPPATEPVATEPAATDGTAGDVAEVSLVEWELIAPTEYAAGSITFNATNDGQFPHEFVVIAGDGYASLPQAENGAVLEDELPAGALIGRAERFAPGTSASVTFDLAPGNYVLLCNIAVGENSHAGAGQTLDVTVS